jgi:MFS family permease
MRRHVAAVTLGNALEFYDFLTYGFFAIQIGHTFFPGSSAYLSLMASLATFGAGFAMRPIGAVMIGRYADRAGRKPAMLLSFVLIGASIFGMALIPSYAAIGLAAPVLAVLARMTQGFSLGGEIGSNTSYLLEAAAPAMRGFIVSWQGASQLAAIIAGSLIGAFLTAVMPPDMLDAYGWRIAFAIGGIAVPFGLWLRSNLPETLHATQDAMIGDAAVSTGGDGLALARRHWRVMVLGLVVLGMTTVGNYISLYAVTFAQDTLHLPAQAGFVSELGNSVAGFVAVLLAGWLSDRHGRWPVNAGCNFLYLVLIYPLFAWVVSVPSPLVLFASMTILGFVSNLTFGVFLAALGESLPKSIRASGFGTVYSLAIALFGGSTQFVVTWLIHVTGSAMAPAWYLTGAIAVAQVAYMLFPESHPTRARPTAVAAAMGA